MIELDYAEVTGQHLRVGLVDDDGLDAVDDIRLENVARLEVTGELGICWDVNHTSATTVELSFELHR